MLRWWSGGELSFSFRVAPRRWSHISFGTATRWHFLILDFSALRAWSHISFATATRPRFSILDFSALRPWSHISFGTATRWHFSILDFSALRPWSHISLTTASWRRNRPVFRSSRVRGDKFLQSSSSSSNFQKTAKNINSKILMSFHDQKRAHDRETLSRRRLVREQNEVKVD